MRALVFLLAALPSLALAEVRVAVVPFDNAGGAEFDGLSVGLQSMVTTDLAAADEVTVVERAKLQALLQEVELSRDGVLDPETAVEIGRVAGATHVVAGSFTVIGDTMRLDARLADVETGEVAVAAEASGERDAFFELEKDLVKALLKRVGAELSPKERAAVGKLHTADFESFRRFGEGVALFDAQRYSEAIALLESVSASDEDFDLATVTLADIRSVAAEAEEKARAARIANAEEAFVAYQEAAEREAAWLKRLRQEGTDPSADWRDRTTANLLLVVGAARFGRFSKLRKASDPFALERLSDQAYQRVWAEMRPRVPEWFPVQMKADPWFGERFDYDSVFARHRQYWFDSVNPYYDLSSCPKMARRVDEEALVKLWVPLRRRLELARDLLLEAECLPLKDRRGRLLDLAEAFADEGRFAEATALLTMLKDASTDERFLGSLARSATQIAERKATLDAFPEGSLEYEALVFKNQGSLRASSLAGADRERLLSDVTYYVREQVPFKSPLFIGDVPAWSAARVGQKTSVTGPRSAYDVTASLRHYEDTRPIEGYRRPLPPAGASTVELPTLWIVGGVATREVEAAVTVDFRPAEDWFWPELRRAGGIPEGWEPLEERPTAGLIVGLREIGTPPVCDPLDATEMTPVPTTGIAVVVRDGQLLVAPVEESFEAAQDRCGSSPTPLKGLALKAPLGKAPVKGSRVEVRAKLEGTTLVATAGKAKVVVDLPGPRAGFVAIYADGPGYAELSGVALE